MKNLKLTLLYLITVVSIIAAVVWEYYMQQWIAAQPEDAIPVMRDDLFVIYPVIITLVALSLYRLFRKKTD